LYLRAALSLVLHSAQDSHFEMAALAVQANLILQHPKTSTWIIGKIEIPILDGIRKLFPSVIVESRNFIIAVP
jgi:hypothetical protein